MNRLELKIPPPVVTLLFGLAMWGIALLTKPVAISLAVRASVAIALALVGAAFSLVGVLAFLKARTTVNPLKPERTSALVTGSIYRITRNPMYVGFLFVLLAWAALLAAPWSLLGPIGFMVYLSRFQIMPEERVLATMFGPAYAQYKASVRRWL
jgi:protein-S-isoprenylcysteine O-methyltransferase Ste14